MRQGFYFQCYFIMRHIICKAALAVWLIATNLISAAAFEAAFYYPPFRFEYIVLGITLLAVYWWFWYARIRKERGKGVTESVLHYYLRTRLFKGGL